MLKKLQEISGQISREKYGDQTDQISAIDKRSRADGLETTRQAMRNAEGEIRELITSTNKDIRDLTSTGKRWDDKLTKVDTQIENIGEKNR